MKLDEFVASSLTQIARGIAQAQEDCEAEGLGLVNPPEHRVVPFSQTNYSKNAEDLAESKRSFVRHQTVHNKDYTTDVHFDVAITIGKSDATSSSKGTSGSGKAGIGIPGVIEVVSGSIEHEGKSQDDRKRERSTVTRIAFAVKAQWRPSDHQSPEG